MARKGCGGPALATAAIGSFVAALIATIGLAFLAPILVKLAVRFGPWDYFGLMLIAFVTVSATFGSSSLRGLTSLAIVLWRGLIGIDQLTGQTRLAFGVPNHFDVIKVTTLAVGLFAIGEALHVVSRHSFGGKKLMPIKGSIWMTRGLGALVEAMAARRRHRLPHRRPASGRCRDPDLPQLHDEAEAVEEPRGIRPRRHRGRGRA